MGEVSRREVVQAFLDLFEAPAYLEVGVFQGETFSPLRAARKVAVDPSFPPGVAERLEREPATEVHRAPSDAYFGGLCRSDRFDVIYLDGLHTFEQTLRDLLNAVLLLRHPGVIVVDDVLPDSYAASLREMRRAGQLRQRHPSANGNWMGDVYRLVFFVDSFLQQFRYRMVADNHGQLVIWRARRPEVADRRVEWVARAAWEDIVTDEATQRRMPLAGIVEEVARSLRLPRGAAGAEARARAGAPLAPPAPEA